MTQDEIQKEILTPFHKTDEWFNEGWEHDKDIDDKGNGMDDNYSPRHDAFDVTASLISYLYENGFKIVKE